MQEGPKALSELIFTRLHALDVSKLVERSSQHAFCQRADVLVISLSNGLFNFFLKLLEEDHFRLLGHRLGPALGWSLSRLSFISGVLRSTSLSFDALRACSVAVVDLCTTISRSLVAVEVVPAACTDTSLLRDILSGFFGCHWPPER